MTTAQMPAAPLVPTPDGVLAGSAGPAAGEVLRRKVGSVRVRQLQVTSAVGICLLVVVAVLGFGATLALDWVFDFPAWFRALLLMGNLCLLGGVFWLGVGAPLVHRPDDDEMALLVERNWPEFRSRLIASVQLSRPGVLPPGASAPLVDALVKETEAMAAPKHFPSVVDLERLGRVAGWAFVAAAFAGIVLSNSPAAVVLLKRAFMADLPVPRDTRIVSVTGDVVVPVGDDVVLAADAAGVIPAGGTLEIRYDSGRVVERALAPSEEGRNRYAAVVEEVPGSFRYTVHLNDGESGPWRVSAIPRPGVGSVSGTLLFPPYTGRPPAPQAPGGFALLAGAELQLEVIATKPVRAATLKLVGLDRTAPLAVDPARPERLTVTLPVPEKSFAGFTFELEDTDGLGSRDVPVFRVEWSADQPPDVHVFNPVRREDLVTRRARIPVGFEASDDYGVASAALVYAVDGAEARRIDLDIAAAEGEPTRRRARYEWDLGTLQPPLEEGQTVEFWVEVSDVNDRTGPGFDTSEHLVAKVVSQSEKRADLLNRVSSYLNNVGEVTIDQERLNRDLGTLIRERRPAPPGRP